MATAFIVNGKRIEVPRSTIAEGGKAVEKYLESKAKPKTAPKKEEKPPADGEGEEAAGG